MASAWAKSPSLARGSAATLSLLLQCEKSRLIAAQKCPSVPFFFGSAAADACSNLPVHHHPGFTSGDGVVPLTRNMPQPRRHPGPVSTSF